VISSVGRATHLHWEGQRFESSIAHMEHISSMEVKHLKKLTESKEIDDILECIEKIGLDVEKIGEGGNAEVFSVAGESNFSKFCLKKIREKPQIQNQDIDMEHAYQIKVRDLGVTTPLSLVSFDSNKGSYLLMEKINGHSVREIAHIPNLLSEEFNMDIFEKELNTMISRMHQGGILHRDLNLGNVMVNEKGLPVIIDFATATEGDPNSEFAYQETIYFLNKDTGKYEQKTYYVDDRDNIKNILRTLRVAVNSRQLKETSNI
jgi:tRNA A-37 threonylcarbamoyl transferase component Bud32